MSSDFHWNSWQTASEKTGEIAGFCRDLRDARLSSGLTLEAVAEKIHSPSKTLEALENGRWGEIEAPFLKRYICGYAEAVGLNADDVLNRFRKLGEGHSEHGRAMFDDTAELLPKPESVGVTRAKIMLGWLAASRRVTLILFIALIATFLMVLFSARRSHEESIAEAPFNKALRYARNVSHGPIEFIAVESEQTARRISTFDLIATGPCLVRLQRSDEMEYRRRLQPFDTLRISVEKRLFLTVEPAMQAGLFLSGQKIQPTNSETARRDTFDVTVQRW
ncbi:helix-turn-helix domain-containing protein [bacterium]|nr:helix-turn-helix domain-containing protein [bacterium]